MRPTTLEDLLRPAGAVEVDANLATLSEALRLAPGLVVPLVDDLRSMRLMAEVTQADLDAARRGSSADVCELRASDVSRPPVTCLLSDTPEASLAIMRSHERAVLHVVDSRGRLCGSLSIEDVFAWSDDVAREANAPAFLRTALAPWHPSGRDTRFARPAGR